MAEERDMAAEAVLLETLPRETEGDRQFRELVRGTVERCFTQAGTLTPAARRRLHIELADGGRIDTAEIAAHFGDPAAPEVDLKPTDLV